MSDCPRTRRYGAHDWRGEMLKIDAWAVLQCRNCGRLVLHDISGKKVPRGPQR